MSDSAHQIATLRRLLDISTRMAATTDLSALLGTIVEAACETLECERASIFLYDSCSNELYSRAATGVVDLRIPADSGIAGAAATTRRIINVPDAYSDPRFNAEVDRRTGFHTRNLLTFPLINLENQLVGVLQALNRRGCPFNGDDEDLARVLSAQAGVAIHRWRLLEIQSEMQRMERDLELARQIQREFFPDKNPAIAGYDIAGWNMPADETGGDCYDFLTLDDGRLVIMLADAVGHGIAAALLIAQCRSLMRAILSVTSDLSQVASRVNRLLLDDIAEDRFVTAFIGILDPVAHRLDYVAGGQAPLLFVSGREDEVRDASGLPFAVIPDVAYVPQQYNFAPGAQLVLLTDGFYETQSPDDELFGEQRVAALVRQHGQAGSEALIARLHAAVLDFRRTASQADDLTAVIVRRVT